MPPKINQKLCIGCQECARNCPKDAIKLIGEKAIILDSIACIDCNICVINCPVEAIIPKNSEPKGI